MIRTTALVSSMCDVIKRDAEGSTVDRRVDEAWERKSCPWDLSYNNDDTHRQVLSQQRGEHH